MSASPQVQTPPPVRLPTLEEALRRSNPEQRSVIEAPQDQHMAVLAGAGTGKTSTVTLRIAHLLESGVPAEAILALTFTRKAADEMRERLAFLVGRKSQRLAIHTFHGWGLRLIQQYGTALQITGKWQCLGEDDMEALVRRQLKLRKDWDPKELKARDVLRQMLEYKLRLHREGLRAGSPVGVLARSGYQPWIREGADPLEFVGGIHRGYEAEKAESSLLDYVDLLALPLRIFRESPEALAEFRAQTTHLLVDEFQDTDTDQYALIELLHQHGQGSRTFVVGDDDQSLYGWRGALPGIFQRFLHETRATLYRLEENYRCQPWILECANRVIQNNEHRLGKALRPNRGQPDPIRIERFQTTRDEAQQLVKAVQKQMHRGRSPEDIAILYRKNRFSADVEKALTQARIPYRVYGGTNFFKREEIRNAMAYLRLALNPDDNVAFRRIVDVPRRRIGPKTLEQHAEWALEWNMSLGKAARHSKQVPLREFGEMLHRLETWKNEAPPVAVAGILKDSGLIEWYGTGQKEQEKGEQQAERLEDLIESARTWEALRTEGPGTLADFILEATLESDAMAKDGTAVRLMTIHQAKGLEFPVVFVVGLEEGEFPSEQSDLEEERRLFYVALTRGKDQVHLSYVRQRLNAYREIQIQRPSCFLRELPKAYIQRQEQSPPKFDGLL